MIDALRPPIRIGGTAAVIATSVGIAVSSPGADGATELLRNADFAMYQAKHGGKGRYEVFRPSLREAVSERAALEALLRGAEDRDELRLHYQPVVDLTNGDIVGIEALVRWEAPGRGLLMPADFIGLAEDSGLIVQIGRWVLEQRLRRYPGLAPVASISTRWRSGSTCRRASSSTRTWSRRSVRRWPPSGLDPSRLILEITESVLMQTTTATIGKLADLRRIGVRLAIDDFGTGYSSLGYLERFPVDILKIDKTFIDGIGERGNRPVLARAIVQLGRALGPAGRRRGHRATRAGRWASTARLYPGPGLSLRPADAGRPARAPARRSKPAAAGPAGRAHRERAHPDPPIARGRLSRA